MIGRIHGSVHVASQPSAPRRGNSGSCQSAKKRNELAPLHAKTPTETKQRRTRYQFSMQAAPNKCCVATRALARVRPG